MKNWIIAFMPFGIPLMITGKLVKNNPVAAIFFLSFCFLTVPAMAHGAQVSVVTPIWVYAWPITLAVGFAIVSVGLYVTNFLHNKYGKYGTRAQAQAIKMREEKELAFHKAKIEKAMKLDVSRLLSVNSSRNERPTFNSRYTNIVVWTPMGCFVGKKTPENYYALATAGYYQDTSWIPVFEKLDSKNDIPFDPETNIAITGESLQRWLNICETWKIECAVYGNPDVAYNQLKPQFEKNEQDGRFKVH